MNLCDNGKGTHARVLSPTLVYGNGKNKIKQRNEKDGSEGTILWKEEKWSPNKEIS